MQIVVKDEQQLGHEVVAQVQVAKARSRYVAKAPCAHRRTHGNVDLTQQRVETGLDAEALVAVPAGVYRAEPERHGVVCEQRVEQGKAKRELGQALAYALGRRHRTSKLMPTPGAWLQGSIGERTTRTASV